MEKPTWVKRVNYIGAAAGGAARLISLNADDMLQVAMQTTGLTDFGGTTWEEPYRRLIASIDADVQLHTLGRLMTRGDVIRALRNRLLVTDALRREPAILDECIEAPVVIAGQGRTGTSILFELLSLDPNNRAPLAWEAASPVAPPAASLGDDITQAQIAEVVNEFWADVQPEIKAAHEHRWDLPAECIRFLDSDFTSDWWIMLYGVWSWAAWRQEAKPDTAYDWHQNVVRLLQHGQPRRRWLWKSPAHLGALDRLLARYPDAKIIHTHRDPAKTIPSTVSLSGIFRTSRADNVDLNLLGQMVVMGYGGMLRKVIDERAAGVIPPGQIVDSHFLALMRDPVAGVERLYAQLGLEFSGAFADRISTYLRDKPRDKFGKHRYAAEDYGLTDAGIREQFRFYTDHYGIELEGAAS